ncbi:M14 family metallopeptidase [Candidatus Chloroploca mongolica]|uniref:M14 family metallopeptidase n=1 Tax=Candidatus Chloroploca mongolica TaxID=2528176 RepID=UPI0020B29477|nr:M14 family metallopeptidase [Candidatus Chloroploca mongolica]
MQFLVLVLTTLWLTVLTSPLLAWQPLLQATPPQQSERRFVLGLSAQGRPIEVVQFGDGPRKLVVVGNTHGGPEANTYRLTNELIAHLAANPELVPPSVRLFLIPSLNPDGLALGWRFDAAGVDLNRNMNTNLDACSDNDWRQTVFGAYGLIAETGGPYPDSQVEVRLLRAFLFDAAGAIFLHSNAGLVFPASCEHAPSIAMAERYANAAGYLYSRYWPLYAITGGMHDWAGSMGIAAITPELITGTDSEFAQNLAGLLAVLEDPDKLLPLPEDGEVAGQTIPAPLYRYWRALGGEAQFGVPQGPARQIADEVRQRFATVELVMDNEQRDTIWFVQPAPLGSRAATSRAYGGADALVPLTEAGDALVFPETGHRLRDGFRAFWQREGGLMAFGLPLSEEFRTITADGQERTIQYFERAIFAYAPEDGTIRLEPLGLREATLERMALPARQMAR